MARMSGARNRSLIYCITRSRFTRAGSSSRADSLIPARHFSLSLRLPEIHRADNAKGPAARRGNAALRPSLARSRVSATPSCTRHRMDFHYVTRNPCRVYDYSLRDGDATVTHTRAHTHTYRYKRDDNNDEREMPARES